MPNKAQTVLPAPDAMERTEIARAIKRTTSRRSRFHVAAGFASDHSDERGFSARALDALGIQRCRLGRLDRLAAISLGALAGQAAAGWGGDNA